MDVNTFRHLEKLSKLSFTSEDKEQAIREMEDIIGLMDTIKEFDLSYDDEKDNNEICFSDLREDISGVSFSTDLLLQNTDSIDNCYVIPKMME